MSGMEDSPAGSVEVMSVSPGTAAVCCVSSGNPCNLSGSLFPNYRIEGDGNSASLTK